MKLVPFNAEWVAHETLDLHAIYRRPQRIDGELVRDADGFIQWDLTTGLPLRSHAKWSAKGFEYVTLASTEDVVNAADPERAVDGVTPLVNPQQYLNQTARTRGPWDAQAYLAEESARNQDRRTKLLERIATYGPDAAEEFVRERDPDYVLPEALRTQSRDVPEAAPRKRGRPRKVQAEPEAVVA